MKEAKKLRVGKFIFESVVPNKCPHCQMGTDPKPVKGFVNTVNYIRYAFVAFKCPLCENVFFAKYVLGPKTFIEEEHFKGPVELPGLYYMEEVIGGHGIEEPFSEEITKVSGKFVSIFHEADFALQNGKNYVAGVGFRLAFEFLIKDYLSSKGEDVSKSTLRNCIDKLDDEIYDKRLFVCTTWLGNDFAHYLSQHPEFDVHDLRYFILSCVEKVDRHIKNESFIETISPKKEPKQ